MARPRTPTAIHQARGTYRADRHGRAEPQSPPATADVPAWAALKGEAAACYRRLALLLTFANVLTEADTTALVQLARRYQEYVDAAGDVREQGSTYASEGRDGTQIKTHPAVAMRDRAWADFQRGLIDFGLTPASRGRVTPTASSDEGVDPLRCLLTPR